MNSGPVLRYAYYISLLVLFFSIPTACSSVGGKSADNNTKNNQFLSEKIVTLEPRTGAKLKFLLIKPENPIASVILFPGGPGILRLSDSFGRPNIRRIEDVYLVRNRNNYAREGLMVALMDVPSDCKNKGAMGIQTASGYPYKMSKEIIQDIKSVIRYLKNEKNCPVWIMGTCRGTISVANAGINIKDDIDGLVFTSPLTKRSENHKFLVKYPNAILDMKLDQIQVPVLITAHRDDCCVFSQSPEKLRTKLINAPEVQLGYFSGGKEQKGGSCEWFSPHGFYGIEEQVDKQITKYIKSTVDKKYKKPIFQSEYLAVLNHESVTFEETKGKKIKIMIAKPQTPKGIFVMFCNYAGTLKIVESVDGPIILRAVTTVSRCMDRLAKLGYVVVLVDSINSEWLTCSQRVSSDYLTMIKPVFTYLKNQFDLPIWCVGHGAGCFSAVNAALNLPQIEALFLISPIISSKDDTFSENDTFNIENGLLDMDLAGIQIPAFVIAHTKDHSGISGPRAAKKIHKKLVNSPLAMFKIMSEGRPNKQEYGKIPHYFRGRADLLVKCIAEFAELNLP